MPVTKKSKAEAKGSPKVKLSPSKEKSLLKDEPPRVSDEESASSPTEVAAAAQLEATLADQTLNEDYDVPQDALVVSDDDIDVAADAGSDGDEVMLFPEAEEIASEMQKSLEEVAPLHLATVHTAALDGSDVESDSSDDADEATLNRVGDIPLEWYKDQEHIGYDVEGRKLLRKERSALQQLIDETDDPNAYRTIYDALHDEKKVLTNAELAMIFNLQRNRTLNSNYNMYADALDTSVEFDPLNHPLARPHGASKKAFVPRLHEMKVVAKMVKRLLRGEEIDKKEEEPQEEPLYTLWDDSKDPEMDNKTKFKYLHRVPKPLHAPPGTYESYRPPAEYLPSEKTKEKYRRLRRIDRKEHFLPEQFEALRYVPFYNHTIQDRYQRCLDLAFFPRRMRTRIVIEKNKLDSLLPELPDPKDLRPYPERLSFLYKGHTGTVRSLSLSPAGEYLATACDDHIVRIFEVLTGRLVKRYDMGTPVQQVVFDPNSTRNILAVAADYSIVLIVPFVCAGHEAINEHSLRFLRAAVGGITSHDTSAGAAESSATPLSGGGIMQAKADEDEVVYSPTAALDDAEEKEKRAEFVDASGRERSAGIIVKILMHARVKRIVYHPRGDYMCALCPKDHVKYRQTVMLQISKRKVFCPFRKFSEVVIDCAFHPQGEPLFFLATTNSVRVYNLIAQKLQKRYKAFGGIVTSLSVHGGGENFLVGDTTMHTSWFDCDFSDKPYKRMRTHKGVVNCVEFDHCSALDNSADPTYPLFATGASDGQVHIFHGKVFDDYNKNALIVPVKILKHSRPVYAICWHPALPWVFTATEDGTVCCWTD